ncbi:MAG: hypothetical protein NTX32_01270 [Candidatus Firestonebacteria bacterium]|nr:hypothetical protein [Candidatus Firestonebacteria bacterium]
MRKLTVLILVIFSSCFLFGEAERLDDSSDVKIAAEKFTEKKGIYSTDGTKMIDVSEKDPAFVEVSFPAEWTIVKIFIITGKTTVESSLNGNKEVSSMCNFTLRTKTKYGDYKEIRRYTGNTSTKLEIKEKIKTNSLRIQLLPYREGSNKGFGSMKFEIWGYKGEAPKEEKIKIKTKEDASRALRKNQITSQEYMELLKSLPK